MKINEKRKKLSANYESEWEIFKTVNRILWISIILWRIGWVESYSKMNP